VNKLSKKFLSKYNITHPDEKPPEGYVYIIQNGNRFKIGKTKNDPNLRKNNLTLKEAGKLVFSCKYKNYHYKEKEFHLLLNDKRVYGSEWFEELDGNDFYKVENWKNEDKI
jgi:hypothetical protein